MRPVKKTAIFSVAAVLLITSCKQQGSLPAGNEAAGGSQQASVAEPAQVAAPKPVSSLKIINWAPQTTKAGVAFNAQPDGNSGVFFELDGDVPPIAFTATFDGKPMSGVVASGHVVTATIPSDYLKSPGQHQIEIQAPSENAKIGPVTFTIE